MNEPSRYARPPIRVAHVITRLCKGGAQMNTFHTARLANRDRFVVDLISGPTRGAEGSIEHEVRAAGIDIIRIPGLVRQVAPVRDIIALHQLTRLFRRQRYHIVHTHTSKAGFLGRLAAERAGAPIVVHTPHGNIFDGYFAKSLTRVFVWMERHAARRCDRIITLTAGGIDDHIAEDIGQRDQYTAIFSGIDLTPYEDARERRAATRKALDIGPSQILVGGVGRLEPVKGFMDFAKAAQIAATAMPETRFILAGYGSQETVIHAAVDCLGDAFRLLGPRDDIPDLMAAMDICVVPSLNEGMGRVLLEAGAAGTPAVATDVGGIPDVIRAGETGILVGPRDPESLAHAICALARDGELRRRMGAEARRVIVPHYGLERMVERIEALYEELIREKGLDP